MPEAAAQAGGRHDAVSNGCPRIPSSRFALGVVTDLDSAGIRFNEAPSQPATPAYRRCPSPGRCRSRLDIN
ncbi:hypothetical protein GCM10027280_36800 [Micromonospora polyrhachis]